MVEFGPLPCGRTQMAISAQQLGDRCLRCRNLPEHVQPIHDPLELTCRTDEGKVADLGFECRGKKELLLRQAGVVSDFVARFFPAAVIHSHSRSPVTSGTDSSEFRPLRRSIGVTSSANLWPTLGKRSSGGRSAPA